MGKQIICKIWDNPHQKRVIAVKVDGEGQSRMLDIWNRIDEKKEAFFTDEKGHRADVKAVERSGTKFLTTKPDSIVDNNLDELDNC